MPCVPGIGPPLSIKGQDQVEELWELEAPGVQMDNAHSQRERMAGSPGLLEPSSLGIPKVGPQLSRLCGLICGPW